MECSAEWLLGIRAYRTISHVAATVLTGQPPLEFIVSMYLEIYEEVKKLRRGYQTPSLRAIRKVSHAWWRFLVAWSNWLCQSGLARRRVVEAIVQPRLADWLGWVWGELSFRVTQVLTGHGCFGSYLCRIGRERTMRCHHCGASEDLA